MRPSASAVVLGGLLFSGLLAPSQAAAVDLVGPSAFGDWTADSPGTRRLIRPQDLPAPYDTVSVADGPTVVPQPAGAQLRVPDGFRVQKFFAGLAQPRNIKIAPNGDIFVSEGPASRIRVLRPTGDNQGVDTNAIFASGLNMPFGMAFYPANNPQYLYVAETNRIVRFPYSTGDMTARGGPQVIISSLPTGGHWTRDIAFGPNQQTLFISVGSATNTGEGMGDRTAAQIADIERQYGRGAAWGNETNRAVVLATGPTGYNGVRTMATGLRNCASMAVNPNSGDLWCAVIERDRLGDNLVPDLITRVGWKNFYGWPWYYPGPTEQPTLAGKRPDLRGDVKAADVLIQPHSSPLGITFYTGSQFPASYRGDAFVTLRGSWNRSRRTGYKLVRVPIENGRGTGWYEDFLTGFVVDQDRVWGRPVGIAVARDGALLMTEDGNATIWRISYQP